MARTTTSLGLVFLGLALTISAAAQAPAAQSTTSQAPTAPKPAAQASEAPAAPVSQSPRIQNPYEVKDHAAPDMVCFGYGPKWSIQFTNGAARLLGVNQPDDTYLGDFYRVSDANAWEWHRADDLAPMNGSFGLSATIQKESCHDPVRGETFPYSGQINLPQGDMVSGCCRKLKPGEAVVGKHGLQQTAATPSVPAPTGSTSTQSSAQPQQQQSNSTLPSTKNAKPGIPQRMPQ